MFTSVLESDRKCLLFYFFLRPTFNEDVFVEVLSRNLLQEISCYAIGGGKLINTKNVAVKNSNHHTFKFKATLDLVPKAKVIIGHVKNGELHATTAEISIEMDSINLKNFIKLKLSPTETKPGKNVSIAVSTNPKSHIGLVGIDQSVLLLKKIMI